MKINKILVSKTSYESTEFYDLIDSNISVINLLMEEGVNKENLHEDAIISYYVNYYQAQYLNGNFSQFVWNSGWDDELNELIEKGLEKIGAVKHLELFKIQSEKVEALSEEELDRFFESNYFGPNKTRDKLRNSDFFSIKEDITELHYNWLKNHPDLFIGTTEEIYAEIENYLGRKITR